VAGVSRRQFLWLSGSAALLAACSNKIGPRVIGPHDPAVRQREALRRGEPGAKTVTASVTAAPVTFDLAGRPIDTWAFGARPGDGGLRANAGDTLVVKFHNELSPNTLHWHGIALRNDMDGVHMVTQDAVPKGGSFVYRFTVPDPGTYWFHPHRGLELDRGLYAPLIVDDPAESLSYDAEAILIVDDWLDGFGRTQQQVLSELARGGSGNASHMGGGMDHSAMRSGESSMMGFGGDVAYPLHLLNGRAPAERETVMVRSGQRIRLRIINAASDTAYRVAVGGHRLTVTHADGFPVESVDADHVIVAMAERLDVIVTARSGAWPIVAIPEGKTDPAAEAVLRTTDASVISAPPVGARPAELDGLGLTYSGLRAIAAVTFPPRRPDRTETLRLTADASAYVHQINGRGYPDTTPIEVREGERLRLRLVNNTMMFHPMHLHGHTFQLVGMGSARKDTVAVMPMESVEIDVQADNPGRWMLHCHNTYHLETGMAVLLDYVA